MRKKKTAELIRIQNVIEGDRLNTSKEFEEVLLNDLTGLLNDYFDISQPLEIKIEKQNKNYKVLIGFDAQRVRNFGFLQNSDN